ncbi:hypothetical protein N7541_005540 [Penicillium brevicompactum]|uniref:Poly [ADP-ribose] polymerase n=1 Tax=Penicillium brevicompactum TaxID=5074 RepID=A0A9W9R6D1_PENBR|nr:hypothetical protein N7541_005540 [Penicillium brevicompactum]
MLLVRSARASGHCQLVTYDWLLGIISEDSSDIKQLLGKLTALKISDKPPSKKRKLEADPGDGISKKLTKTVVDAEVSIPVEVLEDGTRIPLNSTKLNQAVNGLLSLMSSKVFEQHTRDWIKGLPTGTKTRSPLSPNLSARKQEYLSALQKFEASLDHDTTDVLYRGLLSLQLTELTALKKPSEEFKAIAEYHSKSTPLYPNIQIVDIFRIERHGEKDNFEEWSKKNVDTIGDRRLVWHGSANANFLGILSQGLRLNNGGVWFAEVAELSVGFCDAMRAVWLQGVNFQNTPTGCLMLLCELECGKNMLEKLIVLKQHLSVPIHTSIHKKWRDAGCVHPDLKGAKLPDFGRSKLLPGAGYNEYIARCASQIRQRYLIHFKHS